MRIRVIAALAAAVVAAGGMLVSAQAASVLPGGNIQVITRSFSMPSGLAADSQGTVYLAASGDSQIVRMAKKVEAFAGQKSPRDLYNQSAGGYSDGALNQAAFSKPAGLCVFSGGLLVADAGNHAVRFIQNGKVYTFAGLAQKGYRDGVRDQALFASPSGVAADGQGNVYVADTANHVIRKIDAKGVVTTVAGSAGQAAFLDGAALSGRLCDPMGIVYQGGALYIADSGNQRIRMLKDGDLTTVAGGGAEKFPGMPFIVGGYADGLPGSARFNTPTALAFDGKGNLYIADTGNGMVRVLSGGRVSTLLGAEGSAENIYLAEPAGLLIQGNRILVADRFTGYVISVPIVA